MPLTPTQLAEMYARNNTLGRSLNPSEVNLLFAVIDRLRAENERLQAKVNRMVASAKIEDMGVKP